MAPRPPVAPAIATLTMANTAGGTCALRVSEEAQRYHTPVYILDRTGGRIIGPLLCNSLMQSDASIAPHA